MLKTVLFCLVLFFAMPGLWGQSTSKDSAIRIARADVRHFRLNKTEMKQFRKEKRNFDANLFAPTKATTSDTSWLSNPDYVNAFSAAAYKKTKKRRTVWHYAWIAGTAYVVVGLTSVIVVLATGFD